ncbi:hydroxylase [Rhizobium sp. N122]|uniref:SDR family oxidoreductase n=1 Tax=Rhizobium sp. N122 TaxID=1764272 RepID=UPI000B5A8F0D|nr:NAD(P)H-binding protein [Rhizobium sp. N122]OWV83965.1 hydroxylase [Rhizobium sp. N122]
MTYVIHGASGAQGGPVLAALKSSGKPVVAVGRQPGALGDGTPVIGADYHSIEQITGLYQRASGVFVHLPIGSPDEQRTYASNIAAALAQARPPRVVISTSGHIIDRPNSVLQQPRDGAIPSLLRELAEAGLNHVAIAPRLFLENLLLMLGGIRSEHKLRYPLRADIPVSWASHLDVAEAVNNLFDRIDIGGVIAIGQHPGITGHDLAQAFSDHLGKTVVYDALAPEQFGASIAQYVGEGAAAGIAAFYTAINSQSDHSFEITQSAQQRLGLTPRTTAEWLNKLTV